MLKVLVCGSRSWPSYPFLRSRLRDLRDLIGGFTIIHGGARGADTFTSLAAYELHLPDPVIVKPDWKNKGKIAGFLRNSAMLAQQPDYVVAFTVGTGGTADTISKAVNVYRVPTLIYYWRDQDVG